jgi:ubiquinone/menaquinone biosynthesis C-methylase UbiE
MTNADKTEPQDSYYVCPVCKQPLAPTIKGLFCQRDKIEYPVKNSIVDFVTEDLMESPNLFLRSVDKLDSAAETYEAPSWLGTFDMISAKLGLPSYEDIVKTMTEMVDANHGVGLDVACGTGIVTRSIAQKMRLVYGIDISMGMLEKAVEYAGEGGIGNVSFAHSMAEKLPFMDDAFDGVTCSGALHLFQDTAEALNEMARVMKKSARLVVQTFVRHDLSNFRKSFERLGADDPFVAEALEAAHFFDVEELERYLSQTGFRGFEYDVYGPSILFHAEKA